MSKGRPLEGAPGWYVTERRQPPAPRPALPEDPPRPPRAGNSRFRARLAAYAIAATAVVVASLQLLFPLGPEVPFAQDFLSPPAPAPVSMADEAIRTRSEPAPTWPDSMIADREPAIAPTSGNPPPPAPTSPAVLDAPTAQVVALESDAPRVQQAAPLRSTAPIEIRVFIHHGMDPVDRERAQRLGDFLQSAGFDVVDFRRVDFAIERPSVRYFFERDREASGRLVEALGQFFVDRPGEAPDRASDFSHYSPKPRAGNVEVWVAPHAPSAAS